MSEKKGKSKNPFHGIRQSFRALRDGKEPDQSSVPTLSPVCNQTTTPDSHQVPIPLPAPLGSSAQPSEDELLNNILSTIEGLKAVQAQLELKKWSYTDRNGVDVDVTKRIGKILKGAEDYAKIVDVAIQHNPAITALVWAGIRFILMIATNRFQLLEALEVTLATVVEKMAACEFYSHIYKDLQEKIKLGPTSTKVALGKHLDSALRALYIAVQAFLDKAKSHFDPETAVKKVANLFAPFSTGIQPYIQDILDKEKIVAECASMASMDRTMDATAKLQVLETVVNGIRQQMTPLSRVDEILETTKESVTILKEVRDNVRTLVQKKLYPYQSEVLESARFLDPELQRLKRNYFTDSEESDAFEADLYVDTQGMLHPNASESEYLDLARCLHDEFLGETSGYKVCLIQGMSGSGKSTFNHYLARQLWHEYDKKKVSEQATTAIPIFISLASLHDPTSHQHDLILKFFKEQQWSQELIREARENLRFVFILDGYDEIESRDRNFYMDNKLGTWNAKVIITSRPEYLDAGYHSKFYPSRDQTRLLEFWIAPFSPTKIALYIEKYWNAHKQGSVESYKDLVSQPEMQTLLSNPFLLRMFMYVRPTQTAAQSPLKAVRLYGEFLQNWFTRAQTRLDAVQLPQTQRKIFSNLCSQGFVERLQIFCQQFALALYTHKLLEATYNPILDDPDFEVDASLQPPPDFPWRAFLTGADDKVRLLRFSAPLLRNQHSYRFLHKSLRDYLVAQSLWRDYPALNTGSPNARINRFHIVDDPGVIDFVVEQTEADEELQKHLLTYIELSKTDPSVAQAAANAITVLVRAGMRFPHADLQGIRIPGADLSTGWFANAKLQNAHLMGVRLRGAWLRGADLTSAQMQGVSFGERPNLNFLRREVSSCCYSPTGDLLVAVVRSTELDSSIEIWSVVAYEQRLVHTFHNILLTIPPVTVFSPDGTLFACGGYGTILIWSLTSQGKAPQAVKTRMRLDSPYLVFSPDGLLLVSTSENALNLWSVADLRCLYTGSGPLNLGCAAFSPDGKLLAYANANRQISLFSVEEMCLLNTLESHSDLHMVSCMAYSPDGLLFAIGGGQRDSQMVTLWSTAQKQVIHTFHHTPHWHRVKNVVFSRDNQLLLIMTVGDTISDGTITLWSVVGRHLWVKFDCAWTQHAEHITAFSPDNQVLIFATSNSTIRQLELRSINMGKQVNRGPERSSSGSISKCGLAFSADGMLVSVHSRATHVLQIVSSYARRGVSNTGKATGRPDCHIPVLTPEQLARSDCNLEVWPFLNQPVSLSDNVYHVYRSNGGGQSIPFSSDGKLFASFINSFTTSTRITRLTRIQVSPISGEEDASTFVHECCNELPFCVALSPNGMLVATPRLRTHTSKALWIEDSEPGATIMSVCRPDMRYELTTLDSSYPWPLGAGQTTSLAFSPQGKFLARGGSRGHVELWSVTEPAHCSQQQMNKNHTLQVGDHRIENLAFSPDGELLAAGNASTFTIFILHISNSSAPQLQNIHKFQGHTGEITQLAFQPDGCLLFSVSRDATVRVWSMAMKSTECVAQIDTHGPVNAIAWGSPYGREVFAIGIDSGLLQLWRVKKKADYTAENPSIELHCEWSSRQDLLELTGARIEGVTGLNSTHIRLMNQRGAIGEPAKDDEQVTELVEEA